MKGNFTFIWIVRKYSNGKKTNETILNPLNIQVLGESLTSKVFPNSLNSSNVPTTINRLQMQTLELSRKHLESHNIPWKNDRQLLPEISGNVVPKLLGESGNLNEHFMRMAADLGDSHFKLAMEFCKEAAKIQFKAPTLEEMNLLFSTGIVVKESKNGWFKWTGKGWEEASEGPTDKVIIFDIETCPQISQFPILACAYGNSGWYIWMQNEQDTLSAISEDFDKLIPLKHPILVIGHHVAFDRARIREEYCLERGERRFLDTLSMHCAVSGLSSQQRGLWQERKKKKLLLENGILANDETEPLEDEDEESLKKSEMTEKWGSRSSLNNLSDVLQLHCNRKLDKSIRDDLLLKATCPAEIDSARPEILAYCVKDVEATAQLFSVLFPKFLKKSSNPLTFTSLLEMGSFVLPVNRDEWERYIEECDKMHHEATQDIETELSKLVDETASSGLKGKFILN